jgi:hypothetical protein
MHRRFIIKKTWLSAFRYAQSHISSVFCLSLGFLVPWFSSLTAKSDLADFLCYVRRRRWWDFVCLFEKLYLTDILHVFFGMFNINKIRKSNIPFGPALLQDVPQNSATQPG